MTLKSIQDCLQCAKSIIVDPWNIKLTIIGYQTLMARIQKQNSLSFESENGHHACMLWNHNGAKCHPGHAILNDVTHRSTFYDNFSSMVWTPFIDLSPLPHQCVVTKEVIIVAINIVLVKKTDQSMHELGPVLILIINHPILLKEICPIIQNWRTSVTTFSLVKERSAYHNKYNHFCLPILYIHSN